MNALPFPIMHWGPCSCVKAAASFIIFYRKLQLNGDHFSQNERRVIQASSLRSIRKTRTPFPPGVGVKGWRRSPQLPPDCADGCDTFPSFPGVNCVVSSGASGSSGCPCVRRESPQDESGSRSDRSKRSRHPSGIITWI